MKRILNLLMVLEGGIMHMIFLDFLWSLEVGVNFGS